MALLPIVLTLIAVALLLWAANKYIPMEANIRKILNAVVVIVVLVWILKIFGVWAYLSNVHV